MSSAIATLPRRSLDAAPPSSPVRTGSRHRSFCETAALMVTTPVDAAPPSLRERLEADEIVGYARSPSDVLRLLLYGSVALLLLLVTRYAQDAVLGFERDVVSALSFLEPPAARVL